MNEPYLSIVIPAHNEAKRLPATLEQVFAFLAAQPWEGEVLVVENGSQDETLALARRYQARYPSLRVMQVSTRGKGLAVRAGMLAARGRYRFMCDADLSMPIEQTLRFLPPVQPAEAAVIIGSREAVGARRYHEPAHRHWGGRLINWMVQLLVLPGIRDTQCGFKCFRADAAAEIFARQTLGSIAFDVEILFLARRFGYAIYETPIDWYYNSDSRIRLLEDTLTMLKDLFRIRANARRGVYDAPLSAP